MTGWDRTARWRRAPGTTCNYISLTGACRDRPGRPPAPVPLNLVGDFGGGSLFLVTGYSPRCGSASAPARARSVDAAMVDGASVLMQMMWAFRGVGTWSDDRDANLLDGAAPFYGTYTCADGRWIAVAPLEPRFYAEFLAGLGIADEDLPAPGDRSGWPRLRARFTEVIASRPRDEWTGIFAGTDACVTPVLSFGEATRTRIWRRGSRSSRSTVSSRRPQPPGSPGRPRAARRLPRFPGRTPRRSWPTGRPDPRQHGPTRPPAQGGMAASAGRELLSGIG